MPSPFTWLTNAQAIAALKGRLNNSTFFTTAELQLYLNEALRMWNALTEQWRSEFVFTSGGWTDFGAIPDSPRLRTVTSNDLFVQMQYMLLEPPTGGSSWSGTPQFNLNALSYTLQRRRDEFIQATRSNMQHFVPVSTTVNTRRNYFPDTMLSPERIRFLPATSFPPNHTLTREDTQAFQYFQPSYLQTEGYPQSWSVSSEPPLAFDVDTPPTVPGAYDIIGMQSGPAITPPAPSLLGVPDDWSWALKWGALADLLAREPEATDRERSQYCLKRFMQAIEMMNQSNWLLQASVNNVPADTPSLSQMDWTSPEWEDNPDIWPVMVQAGIDLVNVAPAGLGYDQGGYDSGGYGGSTGSSVNVTLVGNFPIPTGDDDFIQVSRDVFDVVLGYAQRIATFKMGGFDFAQTEYLEKDFYQAAVNTNKRLLSLGIFADILFGQGQREEASSPTS